MKNNIDLNLYEIRKKIQFFKEDPLIDANDANLRSAFLILDNIQIPRGELTVNEFKKYRTESLILHVKIIELFEKYYIENYKSNKPYYMNIMPPQGSVDEPIFGAVDPEKIKNKVVREKYKSDVEENNKIGKEIAFQSELTALKHALEAPDIKVGNIAAVELFIKNNYTMDVADKAEIKEIIGKSLLKNNTKDKMFHDLIECP